MIQSNGSIASNHASNIASGANLLGGITLAAKDTVSSYKGNKTISDAIDKEIEHSQNIVASVESFMSIIHSVASEFEAVDNQISQSIDSSSASSFKANPSLFE